MTVVAAIVDVVRAVQPREELQQEAGFVRAAPAEVPEGLVRRQRLQAFRDASYRFVPVDRSIVIRAAFVQDRLHQAATMFQIVGRERFQLFDAVSAPEVGLDRALHIRRHGLQRLLANFGKAANLVDHPAALPAHPQGTCLASVLRPQRLVQLADAADFLGFAERVSNRWPTTAAGKFLHCTPYSSPYVIHDCIT